MTKKQDYIEIPEKIELSTPIMSIKDLQSQLDTSHDEYVVQMDNDYPISDIKTEDALRENASEQQTDGIKADSKEIKQEPVQVQQQENKIDPIEQEARKQGWLPKEEFKGAPERWREANVYLEKKELIDNFHRLKNDMRFMSSKFDEVIKNMQFQHNQQLEEKVYQLQELKKQAIKRGDVEEVEKIDNVFDNYRQEIAAKGREDTKEIPAPIADFMRRNHEWFNNAPENKPLTEHANFKHSQFKALYPYETDEEILIRVEHSVKELFPHRFQNNVQRHIPTQTVANSSIDAVSSKSKKDIGYADMPDDIKRFITAMVRHVPMTRDEYARELYNSGAVKI